MNQEELFKVFSKAYAFLQAQSIHDVRNLAREYGVKSPTSGKKDTIAAELISLAAGLIQPRTISPKGAKAKSRKVPDAILMEFNALIREGAMLLSYDGVKKVGAQTLEFNDSGDVELVPVQSQNTIQNETAVQIGILDCVDNVYFLRAMDYQRRHTDPIVPLHFITKFLLKKGDILKCGVDKMNEPSDTYTVVDMRSINGRPPILTLRSDFDSTILQTTQTNWTRFALNTSANPLIQAMYLLAPVCKGSQVAFIANKQEENIAVLELIKVLQNTGVNITIFVFKQEYTIYKKEIEEKFPFVTVVYFHKLSTQTILEKIFLILEQAKRVVELGGDVLFFIDNLQEFLQIFEKATEEQCYLELANNNLTALQHIQEFFANAKVHNLTGSMTFITTVQQEEGYQNLLESILPTCKTYLYPIYSNKDCVDIQIDLHNSYTKNIEDILTLFERDLYYQLKAAPQENIVQTMQKMQEKTSF